MEPVGHLPPRKLDLEVAWESPWRGFWTNLRDAFRGPRAPQTGDLSGSPYLRIYWVRGRMPGRAIAASGLWHVAGAVIILLPIWGLLGQASEDVTPAETRQATLYVPSRYLPKINLRARAAKRLPPKRPDDAAKPLPQLGADAFNPQQTILSVPVRITHPRQTLIQPDAPDTPPKVVPPMPNIVEWAAESLAKPQLQLAPTAAAPVVRQRAANAAAAPEIASVDKAPINIAPAPSINPHPALAIEPSSTHAAERHTMQANAAAAPEMGAADPNGDASLRRLVALSATPAPAAPEVSIPPGNLAAPISISPAGTRPGVPGGVEHGSGDARSVGGGEAGNGTIGGGAAGGSSNLPAAISISGASGHSGNGGIGAGSSRPLNLKPMISLDAMSAPRRGPSVVGAIDPSLPPEKILSGKEVYTLHVNLPNLTSVTGSWIVNFAELDEGEAPPYRARAPLAGPEPIEKVDPKYPPGLIKEHVDGEVVLYAIIRKDGSVDSIQIVRGIDPRLDRNAIAALAQWKFRPATRDGAPVDLEAVVHIPFTFRNPAP